MYKGIFWCYKENFSGDDDTVPVIKVIPVKAKCDKEGNVLEETLFSSKSEENFNHKREWDKLDHRLTKGKTFNYYPRGRVEIAKGRIKVFANPIITHDEDMVRAVLNCFEIIDQYVIVVSDNSYHYQFICDQDV